MLKDFYRSLGPCPKDEKLLIFLSSWILTFYWISFMFKINRKYFFRKWRKGILFSIIFLFFFHNILNNHRDDFLMETRHYVKALCKQKFKTFFLSTLTALNVNLVLRFMIKMLELFLQLFNNNRETLAIHVTW